MEILKKGQYLILIRPIDIRTINYRKYVQISDIVQFSSYAQMYVRNVPNNDSRPNPIYISANRMHIPAYEFEIIEACDDMQFLLMVS
jgi:hypothetical protein